MPGQPRRGAVKSAPFIFLAGALAIGATVVVLIALLQQGRFEPQRRDPATAGGAGGRDANASKPSRSLRLRVRFGVAATASPQPTVDRLAQPTLPSHPTQADVGAQVYWLHCQPCHGDRGQGLTDEWRDQYPPEDRNCWGSGCHGQRPYESGFTLPTTVPAVIGPGTLNRFETAASLHAFIAAQMPFNAPASLTEAEYWQITAYLIRAHGVPESALPVNDETQARLIVLNRPPSAAAEPRRATIVWVIVGAGVLMLAGAGLWLHTRRRA